MNKLKASILPQHGAALRRLHGNSKESPILANRQTGKPANRHFQR
ncbi:hypothetical protein CPter91_0322 [Collimonas pratensis]|uniref:Uncharacterized protein n=1 Tax=Collimonas pratensis TaxID=279113 RepID=A0A127PY53_9BURK|nr:hypothetical protein CPter91_0322 [Collimonas pratensis]